MNFKLQPLLLLLIVDSLCFAQNNIPKIIKTQGTGQHANVHCGLQDHLGNLWFGTTGEGVYLFNGVSFTNYTMSDGLGSNDIWCIYEDKNNNIWFGTGAGICKYDPSSLSDSGVKRFSLFHIPDSKNNISATQSPSSENAVWSILQDRAGNFWFGTSEGVYRHDGKNSMHEELNFTSFLSDVNIINEKNLHLRHIQSMIEDKHGNIWFASWNQEGVCRFDGKNIIQFKPNGDGMTHALLEDINGNIWVGTRNHGPCYYDGETFNYFNEVDKLNTACIYAMAEDEHGNIWFATEPTGVWYYHSDSLNANNFINLTTKDGLIHNAVFSVTTDTAGKVWFGTRGVGLCNYDGTIFTHFSE